jgi:hypothetical protein
MAVLPMRVVSMLCPWAARTATIIRSITLVRTLTFGQVHPTRVGPHGNAASATALKEWTAKPATVQPASVFGASGTECAKKHGTCFNTFCLCCFHDGVQKPDVLTTFGRSDCFNYIYLDIKVLTQVNYD